MRVVSSAPALSPGRLRGLLRRIVLLTAVLALTAALCAPAAAAGTPGRRVRVGLFPFEGFYAVDSAGLRSGYGYELLQLIALHANLSYEYVDDVPTWGEMEQMLESGQLDLLTCVQKTPAEEARFAFSDTAIGTSSTLLTVKAGNTAFSAGSYAGYAGARVGVIRDNSHAEKFRRFAREHGFSYTEIPYDSLSALESALQSGEVDACVTSSLRPLHGEWILEQFDPSPFYMMMRRDDAALLRQVNQALEQMDAYAPNWRTELFNKYYAPETGGELQLTPEERAYVASQAQTVFQAAVCPDNAPYSYVENGQVKGIIPDIFAQIAARAGIRYETVACADHSAYHTLLRSGAVDLVMDAGWDYSTAENLGFKLTRPYMNLALAQLTRYDRTGRIKTVAVPDGPILTSVTRSPVFSAYRFISYPSLSDTLGAVASGSCDAAFLFAGDAQQSLLGDVHSHMRASLLPDAEIDISVGSAADNDYLLLSVLSKSAESVRGSFVQETVLRHTAATAVSLSLLDYLYLHPGWAAAAAAAFGLLLAALIVIAFQRVWFRRQKQYSANLERAKLESEQANEAKSSFLSSMSHDLRTPLNGVVGFTDLALREPDPEKKQAYLAKIKASGTLLADLVDDTLELSRIESGKLELEPEAVESSQLIGAVVEAVRPAAELKGVRLLADDSRYPADTVWTDRRKFQKVLLNLLSNSVKYTPAGGTVSLLVEILEPPAAGCTRRLVVQDNGIGMSEEFQRRLYEPFAQERRPEAENVAGTGLGLTIVKRIVDLMGGTIRVESAVGRGTRFTVDLPIRPAAAGEAPAPAAPACLAALAGRRVLLCEDNYLNTEIATLLLRERGIAVDCAENGRLGAERFAASAEGTYDAVLMDLRMPEMGGCEAAREIRSMARSDAGTVPIIAMTADAFEEDIRRAREAGMVGYVTKPVDPSSLFAELCRVLTPVPDAER